MEGFYQPKYLHLRIIRLRLITKLPDNAIHHHPFARRGWWTYDEIVDYGVSHKNMKFLILEKFFFEHQVLT